MVKANHALSNSAQGVEKTTGRRNDRNPIRHFRNEKETGSS